MCKMYYVLFFLACAARAVCCEVVGVGGPVMDLMIPVTEEELAKISGRRGGACIVDRIRFDEIRNFGEGKDIKIVPGGSCSNTLRGLTRLGTKCALIGKIGLDDMGSTFLNHISLLGIEPRFLASSTPTAQVICLITPDGERTMRAFPGASAEYKGGELCASALKGSRFVHIEGYTLYNDQLAERAMLLAKENGKTVSFDIGSHEIARNYRETLLRLLENYVDVVFANENEVCTLMETATAEKGCMQLQQLCDITVVLAGKKGCYVGNNSRVIHCPTVPLEAVDCTGAGDFFASGFLFGYLNGCSLSECAEFGNLLGGAAVQFVGADLPEYKWEQICSKVNQTIKQAIYPHRGKN